MTPRLFIGSSTESLAVAHAVQEELEHDAEVTLWSQGLFAPSSTALADLVATLGRFDFGLFVFAPDDLVRLRGEEHAAVRDNVLFELGLFVGRYGQRRSFFVVPRGRPDLRLPTDLSGITPVTYDADRTDGNLRAALGPACNRIRRVVRRLGPAERSTEGTASASDIPLPEVRRRVSDVEKKEFLERAFEAVQSYFERAVLALKQEYPNVQADLEAARRAFLCEVFVDGFRKSRCKVWISDVGFGLGGLAYAEGPVRLGAADRFSEFLALHEGERALSLQITLGGAATHPPDGRVSPDEAATYLWRAFAGALRR